MTDQRRPHPSRRGAPPEAQRPARAGTGTERVRASAARPRATEPVGRTLRDGRTRPAAGAPRPRPQSQPQPRPRHRSKGPLRIPLAHSPRRLRVVLVAMAIALSLCAGRLLQLQGFDSAAYAADSANQLTRTLPLLPSRGDITDRNGLVMAATEATVNVTADPVMTKPKAGPIAAVLAGPLKMDQYQLFILLTKPNTRFVYLAKKVPALTYSKIATELTAKKLSGVFRESQPQRSYPGGQVGSSVIGYVNGDGKGMSGLERSMNRELAGVEGKEVYESGPNGSKIPLGTSTTKPAVNGINYQLTLDSELQWMAERRIAEQVQQTKADSGFAITMNVKTGEILALANAPTFNSARLTKADKPNLVNRAISNPYEPGSVEKVLTSAALIDSGTTNPESKVEVPNRLMSGGRPVKDHVDHKTKYYLMRGVIAESSNIGTILMTRKMSIQRLHDYLTSFGLGQRTGLELPSESAGIVPSAGMADYTRDQVAFGQAIAVTGVQEAAAIAGIVNGGTYNSPTVIKSASDSTGAPVPVAKKPARQVISASSSAAVRDLLAAVVDNNKKLQLPDYSSGGKTGTAQRAVKGGYHGYVTSYVGFAPLNDPKILTYVVLTNPHSGDTGSGTAAPVYKDIMNYVLPRYSVAPDAKDHKPKPIEYKP